MRFCMQCRTDVTFLQWLSFPVAQNPQVHRNKQKAFRGTSAITLCTPVRLESLCVITVRPGAVVDDKRREVDDRAGRNLVTANLRL